MNQKAYRGDLIKVTKAFDEPYSIGDILEVDMRQSDMGACDDEIVITTEGYTLWDDEYKIFKVAKDMKATNWKTEIDKVNQCSQRQDSTKNQLIDLCVIANRLGFYDAADTIKQTFIENELSSSVLWRDIRRDE